MSSIQVVVGRQVLDSRGHPTVEVEVPCEGRARFRLALGITLLAGGVVVRRKVNDT